jgi:methylphosphotriester-DNA--protein-cysteine methyltransferase
MTFTCRTGQHDTHDVYQALCPCRDVLDVDTCRVRVTGPVTSTGWANPSSFIAAFTNMIGTTPGRYRTAHQRRTNL